MGPAQIQGVGKQAVPLSGKNCKITSQGGVDVGLGVKSWGVFWQLINHRCICNMTVRKGEMKEVYKVHLNSLNLSL